MDIRRWSDPDKGASSVEYALLLGAIAAAVVVAAFLLGDVVSFLFDDTCARIASKVTAPSTC